MKRRSSQLKTQLMPQLRGKKGLKIHAGRDSNPDFCITGVALELQANWELVMEMK